MKPLFYLLLLLVTLSSCTKNTRPRYIEKNCCNSEVTQWVLVQSPNDTGPASYFFLPQVFAPGSEGGNSSFESAEAGVANYNITISIGEDIVWLYDGAPPIKWDGKIASSQLAAQSGIYTYNLIATFTNGEVVTITDQDFCLIREFASCPEDVNQCVLKTMFDINDTTLPTQYINEDTLTKSRLYNRCKEV
jgi:hypothetical protein